MSKRVCIVGTALAFGLSMQSIAAADDAHRPAHVLAQAGSYAALGGPASWGFKVSALVLPGGSFGRYGVTSSFRSEKDKTSGSFLLGVAYEAGAARPKLAVKLIGEVGIASGFRPIAGAGIDWSLWLFGPVGLSARTDLQLIYEGVQSRPALAASLCLHIGR